MCKRKGFTLIELLVVIAIIALLISILMPALAHVRKQAKDVVCRGNLGQWGLVFMMYADDYDGRTVTGWMQDLYPYYKEMELLLCPSATKKGTYPGNNTGEFIGGKFEAWFALDVQFPDGTVKNVLASYGFNMHGGAPEWDRTTEETSWPRVDAKGASRGPVLLDSAAGGGVAHHADEPPDYDGQPYSGYGPDPTGPKNENESRNFCINRHHEAINVVFLDSHARKVGLKELWELSFKRTKWFTNPSGFPSAFPPWQFDDPKHWMYTFRNYR